VFRFVTRITKPAVGSAAEIEPGPRYASCLRDRQEAKTVGSFDVVGITAMDYVVAIAVMICTSTMAVGMAGGTLVVIMRAMNRRS
jgi:hypothetical protein